MSDLDNLDTFVTNRLMAAVQEIVYTVHRTVRQYEEETERIKRENQQLKEMLRLSGCFPDHTNAGAAVALESEQPDSPEHNKWISQHKEEPESIEDSQQNQKENDVLIIKSEDTEYDIDTAALSQENSDNNEDLQAFVDQTDSASTLEDICQQPNCQNCNFNPRLQTTAANSCSSPATQSAEDTYEPYTHVPDRGKSIRCTASRTLTRASGRSSSPPNDQDIFHNIFCNNSACRDSKICEMQKRTIARSSPAWKYFSLKQGDCSKAVCLMCKTIISRGRKEYTTSALLKHLRIKHGKC